MKEDSNKLLRKMQAVSASQALLTEQMDELKRLVASIRKGGDCEYLDEAVKMWMALAKDLKRQGEKIKHCAVEVKQAVQKPKPQQDFQSKLKDDEIRELLPLINKFVFAEPQTVESVNEWLHCQNKEPQRVKCNGMIAYLLNLLQRSRLICSNCQKVAADNKTFASVNGKPLNQKDLSKGQSKLAQKVGYKNGERNISAICEPLFKKVRQLQVSRTLFLS